MGTPVVVVTVIPLELGENVDAPTIVKVPLSELILVTPKLPTLEAKPQLVEFSIQIVPPMLGKVYV